MNTKFYEMIILKKDVLQYVKHFMIL